MYMYITEASEEQHLLVRNLVRTKSVCHKCFFRA